MSAFLQKHLSDLLILAGSGLVIYATWILSWIAAIYVGGGILIMLGALIAIGNAINKRAANSSQPEEVKSDH